MRRAVRIWALSGLVLMLAPASAVAAGDGDGGFKLTPVLSGKPGPIDVASPPGEPGKLFVATQGGRVRVLAKGKALKRPFLAISRLVEVGAEEGMLSLAFHPRYKRNGLVYVYLTNKRGNDVLIEYRRSKGDPLRADHGSARRVLTIKHPFSERHNGGELAFGPDGFLYLSVGDGSGNLDEMRRAQARGSLLGKLLRIDPRRVRRCSGREDRRAARRAGERCGKRARAYTAPHGNPFSGPRPGRAEIYSVGFRNPFRFSFDARNGAISIGDVGESCREEVDYRRRGRARGANFGWSRFEGTQMLNADVEAPGAIPPIFEYGHSSPACVPAATPHTGAAIVMGSVVRNKRLAHQYGRLLFADWTNGDIRTLIPDEGGALDEQSTGVSIPDGGAISFGQGARRRLYVISTAGTVYRLDPA